MSLPLWAPLMRAAREDARRTGDDPAAAAVRARDAWLRDAVEAVLAGVAAGADGGLNRALFRAACDLGSLVGAGVLDGDDARERLVDAATAAGHPRPGALATAKGGLRRGAKKPARLPDLDAPARAPRRPVARPAPRPEPPPVRLPADAVARLWAGAWPVFTEPRARRWFDARGLDPVRTAALDLARALPPDADCPEWARCGGRTWATAWPLLLPCFDAAGELVALRARWTATTWEADDDGRGEWVERRPDAGEGGKEVSPRGEGACRGVVYADPVGRWLLRRGPAARPGELVGGLTPATSWSGAVLVVEGGPGWLRYAAEPHRDAWAPGPWVGAWPDDAAERALAARCRARAVLGLWAGAWPDDGPGRELAARIPDGARVVLAPDDDDAGARYADAVTATLAGRAVELRRLPPPTTGGDDGART